MKRFKTRRTFDHRIKIKNIKNEKFSKVEILNQWRSITKWNTRYNEFEKNSIPKNILRTKNGLIIGYENGEIEIKKEKSDFQIIKKVNFSIKLLQFGENKNILIFNNSKNSIIIWDVKEDKLIKKILIKNEKEIKCLKLSDNEKMIYTGGKSCSVKIIDIENTEFPITLGFHEKTITCIEISKNGKILITASKDKKIKIWNPKKKKFIKIFQYHKNIINCLKISNCQNNLYSGGSDFTIVIWDLKNKNFKQVLGNHNGSVYSLEILKNRNLLFSGGEDHKIKLWDIINNEFLGVFGSCESSIRILKFSNDFKSLFVAETDKILKVYKILDKDSVDDFSDSFGSINFGKNIKKGISSFDVVNDFGKNNNYNFGENNNFNFSSRNNQAFGFNNLLRVKSSESKIFTEVDFDMATKNLPFIEKFYFSQIVRDNFNEKIFCSLIKSVYRFNKFSDIILKFFHPITIAIFFGYSEGLKLICSEKLFKYPQFNDNSQISPIILALKIKNNEIIKVLFDFLKKKQNTPYLSYKEIKFLFKDDYPQIDNLIINQCKKLKKFHRSDKYIPSQTRLNKILLFSSFYQGFRESFFKKINKNENKKNNLRETSFFSFKFLFDFTFGSKNSQIFLTKYQNSKNKKLILSPFKHIVNYKWNGIKKYILLHASIFWLHNIFYSIFLINSKNIIFIIDLVIIFFLSFYTILSLILNPKFYLSQKTNYIDIIVLTTNLLTIFLTKYYEKKDINNNPLFLNYFQIISLLVVNIRGFIHLRVFDQFRHLINMIIEVSFSTLNILVVLIYLILASAVMYIKSRNDFNLLQAIKLNFLAVFGNFPKDDEKFEYDISVWFLNFFIGVITSLILVNFLIARMSGKYQDMELKQTIISLKEKVSLILEIEIFISSLNRGAEKIKNLNYTYLFIACVEEDKKDTVLGEIVKNKNKKKRTKKMNENIKEIVLRVNSFESNNCLLIKSYKDLNNKYNKLMEINLSMNKKLQDMNQVLNDLKNK